jgi:hypothetical protein
MHYVIRGNRRPLTNDDERMSATCELARRLEDRLDKSNALSLPTTPDWHPRRLDHEGEEYADLDNIRRLERKN